MNKRRSFLVALGTAALSGVLEAFAQTGKTFRIGLLGPESSSSYAKRVDALRAALRDLGYVEGRNLVIEYRWAEGTQDRLPELARDLVRSKVDVILTSGTPGTRAAKQTTATIPIVMAASGDAVATGLVAGLARPGGNVTGSAFLSPELTAKRLELLKEALPRISQVAYLSNPDNPVSAVVAKAMEATAVSFKVRLQRLDARSSAELPAVFSKMSGSRVDAVVVGQDSMLTANYAAIAELAAKHRIPSIGAPEYGEAGGLFGYGHDTLELWRRSAIYVDKILKGAKPADLPIQQPTKFELVINMKTTKSLAISIPNSIMQRASKVIE